MKTIAELLIGKTLPVKMRDMLSGRIFSVVGERDGKFTIQYEVEGTLARIKIVEPSPPRMVAWRTPTTGRVHLLAEGSAPGFPSMRIPHLDQPEVSS